MSGHWSAYVAFYERMDHARRGQILQDVVTNGCAVLDGHAAADVIVSSAH